MKENQAASKSSSSKYSPKRLILMAIGALAGLAVIGVLVVVFALAMAYPNLPALDTITDYRPKMPLRIFTADNVLIGEFGEERRTLVHFKDIPDVMKKAVLSIEDDRFYEHSGIDYWGILRAAFKNATSSTRQGASTITQQVARNFFLSSEQTFKRKAYEALLAWKIEKNLSKDQILELYMNQIYLGQRAFGFQSAAQIYFGKDLRDITVAEAAMLAGLPKAPSAYNPVVNPTRAKTRQQYILQRMHDLGYITDAQYKEAKDEPLKIKSDSNAFGVHAEYVAEMARQLVYEQFKEDTYTRGLNVFTTITKADQDAAYLAVRRGVMDYERRHPYRGPEGYIEIPSNKTEADEAIEAELAEHPDSDNIVAAIVLRASPAKVSATIASGETIEIAGPGLAFAKSWLSDKAAPNRRLRRGAVIRVMQDDDSKWLITQMPEVESAFVSASTEDGAIRALVGGFDFNRNKFNHVTQAWRQPGSSIKPFVYSAALERGFFPGTQILDEPIEVANEGDWSPRNDDGVFEGLITVRRALTHSRNVPTVRMLRTLDVDYTRDFLQRFGFEAARHPRNLTMALGTGAVTPLQMAGAYAVVANGGYRVEPWLIAKIQDKDGSVVVDNARARAGQERVRVLDARNAFITDSMLRDVARFGTGAQASVQLKRTDLAGKTGTTSNAFDGWFAGYGGGVVGVAWMGYDEPRSLGGREFGSTLALPIWVDYMRVALSRVAERAPLVPEGVVRAGDDWVYAEFADPQPAPAGAGESTLLE